MALTAWDEPCYGQPAAEIEASINMLQEAHRAGISRADAFLGIWGEIDLNHDCSLNPGVCAELTNCLDALLDEVYGPG